MDQRALPHVNRNPVVARSFVAGHFGEILQGRLDPEGPVILVTLPCPALGSHATFDPAQGALHLAKGENPKARRAAALALDRWAPSGWAGTLDLQRTAPVGGGAGSSTADVLATIRAIAVAYGETTSPKLEAEICLQAERAVDPLMWPGTVLFASREARMVEVLPPLPRMCVTGGFAGTGKPTNPTDQSFGDARRALDLLAHGLQKRDLDAVARAATLSATQNQQRQPNSAWAGVHRLAAQSGALGVVAAHTGSAIGLIHAPGSAPTEISEKLSTLGLSGVIQFEIGT